MVKNTLIIGLTILCFGLFTSPAFAYGKSVDEKGQNKTKNFLEYKKVNKGTGTADEGDNIHPSGRDRSVEPGNSFPQGNSSSDPDDNGKGPERSNRGPDKVGGSGGEDKNDQDGNNGCGNDDDFEDDNEGWCGMKPKKDPDPKDEDCDDEEGNEEDEEDEDEETDGGTTPDPTDPPTQIVISDQPAASGSVLAATALPNTGVAVSQSLNPGIIGLLMVMVGLATHLVLNKKEETIDKVA